MPPSSILAPEGRVKTWPGEGVLGVEGRAERLLRSGGEPDLVTGGGRDCSVVEGGRAGARESIVGEALALGSMESGADSYAAGGGSGETSLSKATARGGAGRGVAVGAGTGGAGVERDPGPVPAVLAPEQKRIPPAQNVTATIKAPRDVAAIR